MVEHISCIAMYPVSGSPKLDATGYPAKKTMGNPASSTSRDDRPSYEQQWARILVRSVWASSIIVRSREACSDGILPRTLGRCKVTSRAWDEVVVLVLPAGLAAA